MQGRACGAASVPRPYFPGVVVEVDDELEPVPDGLGGDVVELDVVPLGDVELLVPESLLPDVLPVPVDEPGVVVSVVVVLDDEEGGSGGVMVVVLVVVLGVELGGVTTVVRSSLRSQPATPMTTATAKALDNNILDFMGTPFNVMAMDNESGGSCRPFRPFHSQVQCHWTPAAGGGRACW